MSFLNRQAVFSEQALEEFLDRLLTMEADFIGEDRFVVEQVPGGG